MRVHLWHVEDIKHYKKSYPSNPQLDYDNFIEIIYLSSLKLKTRTIVEI